MCRSSAGDRGPVAGVGGRVGKSGKSGISHGKGEGHVVHAGVNCVCNVCGSAHSCRHVVNGTFARAAYYYTTQVLFHQDLFISLYSERSSVPS